MNRINTLLRQDKLFWPELLFKVVYLIHLLACFNPYIDGTFPVKVTLLGTMALGGLLLLCRLLDIKVYFRTPGLPLLLAFLVSFAVPSFLLYRYALVDSLKTFIWMTFQFAILFAFSTRRPAARAKQELAVVGTAIGAFITVENLISILMAFDGYFKVYEKPDGTSAVTGLAWWGRLYGVHGDPNYACVYTIATVLLCAYLFIKYPRLWVRIVTGVAALINLLFIAFTASRTGLICLTLGVAVFAFSWCMGQFAVRRVLKALAVTAVLCLAVVGFSEVAVSGFNAYHSHRQEMSQPGTQPPDEPEDPGATIGRTEEELQGDPTNRRLDIWGSGLEIVRDNPVLGIGFENVLGYADDRLPDTYIVNNDLTRFDAFHNTVVDVLVSQGAVGVLLAGAFAVWFVIHCAKRVGKQYTRHRPELCLCLAVVASGLASTMFLSHVFFVNIASTGVFWLFAGYLAYFTTVEEAE
ncbi:MAG: O-antigen ligase family protein [Ruminococcaceae bacterium]|nr:O-antigen ligase family protein [Oscillospiraceae bacterium]